MGTVLQFRAKRLSGFIPDVLPEPFATQHAEIRNELASLVSDRAYARTGAEYDNACSEINPDCA